MRAGVGMERSETADERLHRFLDIELILHGSVLAPRAETELLARHAIRLLEQSGEAAPVVIDMCCGSGNVGLAIAHALPAVSLLAADLTADTVETARANAARLGLSQRARVFQGDLFGALAGECAEGRAAMIVCNPPYISTGRLEGESAHLLESEPREAFDGGPYGISIQQRLVREAPGYLKPGGLLLFEFGVGQERQAQSLLTRSRVFECLDFPTDEEGRPRVAVARLTDVAA
jgi:release factor glutamine methyltransferase